MRTASILNSSVYRALGLPIAKSSVAEVLHTLSNGYVFRGQGQYLLDLASIRSIPGMACMIRIR
jgi:hypothetical protein